jgi:hypothetical protein
MSDPITLSEDVQRNLILGALISSETVRRQVFESTSRSDIQVWADGYAESNGLPPFDSVVLDKLMATKQNPCAEDMIKGYSLMFCRHWPC